MLSQQQGEAVKAIADQSRWKRPNRFSWLAGYAGSGKTYIARNLVEELGAKRPLFCAPTNKAAKVLSSKVDAPAMSLHKAIYFPPDEDEDNKSLTWEVCETAPASQADLIIVDEASMVGQRIGSDLMSFRKPVVAIGDPGQLPPVNDDPFFCTGDPDFMLTEIHRQARDNPIIQLSKDIRDGKDVRPGSMGEHVRIARRDEVDIDLDNLPQIITGTNKRRWQVTSIIRDIKGCEGWLPNPGEPLICKKNSQDNHLINGTMCQAITCRDGGGRTCVLNLFDDENQWLEVESSTAHFVEHRDRQKFPGSGRTRSELFDFAWAITCHSAQGSQWNDVLVYDEGYVFKEEAKRWRYTAVTRAADKLTIIL